MRAVQYIRVSDEMQEGNYSLDNQKNVLTKWAKELDAVLATDCGKDGVYRDVLSAKDDKREGFQWMLKDANAGRFNAILTFSQDRFMRNQELMLKTVRELYEVGVFLYCYDLPGIDMYSPEGELMFRGLAGYSEFFRKQLGVKVRAGLMQKKLGGEWVGRPPYGWKAVSDEVIRHGKVFHENSRLEEISEEQKVIEKIWELRKDGKSLEQIATFLWEKEKVKTRKGKKWRAVTIRNILTTPRSITKRGSP